MFDRVDEVVDLARGRGIHLGALPDLLAARYGERVAVEDPSATPGLHEGGERSYRDLEAHTGRLAAALRSEGVGEDQRVLVVVGNRVDVLLHAFALARIGAVAVPVNARLTGPELRAVAEASSAGAAVADGDRTDAVAEAAGLPVLGTADLAGRLARSDEYVPPSDADPDATALLLATSGTTGLPKAAALTSHGLLTALGRLTVLPTGRPRGLRAGRDRVLAALPLTHIMGFEVAIGALCAGVPLLHRPCFVAAEILDLIEQRRPNVFVGVPTMYADLEHGGAAGRDLASIQLWVSAADAMPAERARRFQRFGAAGRVAGCGIGAAAFADVYGMVELSGAAAIRVYPPSPVGAVALPPVGAVLPGVEVRTVDDAGAPVGWGREGHLQFRGPGVLSGYEGRPDSGPDAEGWFATGDHGRLWPGGVFAFAGRDRDRLKVGGFSVFPAEVEEELRRHPSVREVAVVGLPDDRLGERPVALVVPSGEDFDPEEFRSWAEREIAGYRRPRDVAVVDALPRGNHGKVDRAAATDLATDRLGPGAGP